MIYKQNLNKDIKITKLTDLYKLIALIKEGLMKVNKSQIAQELNVDRQTVSKYINGYEKSKRRTSRSKIDEFKEEIEFLLSDETKEIFYYKKVLWKFLSDDKGLKCSTSAFRKYISKHEAFNNYFLKRKTTLTPSPMRYETVAGTHAMSLS